MYVYLFVLTHSSFPSDFTHRCFSTPKSDGGAASKAAGHGNAPTPHATFSSPTPTPLLREWAKATLARRSWKDTLAAAADVRIFFWSGIPRGIDILTGLQFTLPRVTIYRVVCERLEKMDRVTDAIECFHHMTTELGGNMNLRGEQWKWILGED